MDVRLLKPSSKRAFTLLELLVVVAIFVVLGALLLPALARSKARAQAISCINNRRTLAFAWTMYSMDNVDRLAYNQPTTGNSSQRLMSLAPSVPNWMGNVMDWELASDNTNLNFVSQSLLWYEARATATTYRCPADRVLSQVQINAGWSGRVRSVSMNGMVGDPGSSVYASGNNVGNPGYVQFIKESDFKDPSAIFVFMDEHPDSIDDGYFLNNASVPEWLSLPGSYHNGGGSFSFADGHTEVHRWQSASTLLPNQPEAMGSTLQVAPGDTADFDWVNRHASYVNQ